MEYSSEVRQHFLAPARAGAIAAGRQSAIAGALVEGTAEDRSQNFWVRFEVLVRDGLMEQVRYRVFGCPHSLAAAELLALELEGKPVGALIGIDLARLGRQIELPRDKAGKLLRIEDALAACHAQAVAA